MPQFIRYVGRGSVEHRPYVWLGGLCQTLHVGFSRLVSTRSAVPATLNTCQLKSYVHIVISLFLRARFLVLAFSSNPIATSSSVDYQKTA